MWVVPGLSRSSRSQNSLNAYVSVDYSPTKFLHQERKSNHFVLKYEFALYQLTEQVYNSRLTT